MAVPGTRTDPVLTVPNLLSALRLVGVPVFLWLILGPHADGLAVLLLMAAGASDYFDGKIARRWPSQASRLGTLLDPAADRLYIAATLIGLTVRGVLPLWLTALLVARDVVLAATLPVLRRYGYGPLPVHFLGKAATFCLLYAFPALLLGEGSSVLNLVARVLGWAFAIWGTCLYWYAGAVYLVEVRRLVAAARSEPTAKV
jgi:cardiolipin synthase (CMP-forming)